MSNSYSLEPPTKGKVVLKTTYGDLDIELWPNVAPLACRNFCQLVMEGYYNKTTFHRWVVDEVTSHARARSHSRFARSFARSLVRSFTG